MSLYSSSVSCAESDVINNKLWNSIKSQPLLAQCGSVNKSSTQNVSLCDCQLIDTKSGKINCPANKFLSSYYPLANSAKCCSLCDQNKVNRTDENTCVSIYQKSTANKDITCPNNKFIKDIHLDPKAARSSINCCNVEFTPEFTPGVSAGVTSWLPSNTDNKDKLIFWLILIAVMLLLLGKTLTVIIFIIIVLILNNVDVWGYLKRFYNWIVSMLKNNY